LGILLGCVYFQERVLKVLHVWADWFLFSDAYVNGLRATFLRPGNSGVPPFYSLNGDAGPTKENGGGSDSREIAINVREGIYGDLGQDAALAMGEGAAARELTSLPLAELERRCRHNGLSTRGGVEVMVARLLGLEEAEKQRNQEQEEELKTAQGYISGRPIPVVGKDGSDGVYRGRGEGRWSSGGGWTEVGSGWQEVSRYERGHQGKSENGDSGSGTPANHGSVAVYTSGLSAPWPQYQEGDEMATRKLGGVGEAGQGIVSLPQTLAIPQPQHNVFGAKVEKPEPVLPASKWTREDDMSDGDEQGDVKGIGLGYSSSGSDELLGSIMKRQKVDSGFANSSGLTNDTSMDEDRR
jgi:U2-associated protein SR140